jgi:hypothetical protein
MAFFRGPHIVTEGLVNAWDLASNRSYTSGTTIYDLTNNNNLTVNGSPTYSDGQNGDGYGFMTFTDNQTTKYLQISNYSFPTTAVSIEIWCRTSSESQTQALISYAISSDNNENLMFYAGNSSQKMNLFGPVGATSTSKALTEDAWTQVVYTRLSSNGSTKLYYNSQQVFSTTLGSGTNFTSGGTLNFGQEQDSVGGNFDPNQCWVGDYSIIRIYDKVLTAGEVQQNFNANRARFEI